MAIMTTEIGQCDSCKKYGPMIFINHKQRQDFCQICEPIERAHRINDAIELLINEKVTPNMIEKFLKKKPKGGKSE